VFNEAFHKLKLTKSRFTLHPTISLPRVASRLPFTYTGADFYALCSDAMLKAVTRQASLVDSKIAQINNTNISSGKSKISTAYFFDHYASKEDVAVMVTEEDFVNAEKELVPSVSAKELEHYGMVRAQFEKVEDKDKDKSNGRAEKSMEKAIDGIPNWQRSNGAGPGDDSHRPRSNGKGKSKEKVTDRKGKGKEKAVGSWDGSEGDEDQEFFDDRVNGFAGKGKGKGKAVDMGFQDGEDDDEGLY